MSSWSTAVWRAMLAQTPSLVPNPLVLATQIAVYRQELLRIGAVSPHLQVYATCSQTVLPCATAEGPQGSGVPCCKHLKQCRGFAWRSVLQVSSSGTIILNTLEFWIRFPQTQFHYFLNSEYGAKHSPRSSASCWSGLGRGLGV